MHVVRILSAAVMQFTIKQFGTLSAAWTQSVTGLTSPLLFTFAIRSNKTPRLFSTHWTIVVVGRESSNHQILIRHAIAASGLAEQRLSWKLNLQQHDTTQQ